MSIGSEQILILDSGSGFLSILIPNPDCHKQIRNPLLVEKGIPLRKNCPSQFIACYEERKVLSISRQLSTRKGTTSSPKQTNWYILMKTKTILFSR